MKSVVILGIHIIGGAGNTTNCKLLYDKLTESDKKVCIINTDREQSEYEKQYEIFNMDSIDAVRKEILVLKKEYDCIILDTKPKENDKFWEIIEQYIALSNFTFFCNKYTNTYRKDSTFERDDFLGINKLLDNLKKKNIAYFDFNKDKELDLLRAVKIINKVQ